jgi:hypothetical protein
MSYYHDIVTQKSFEELQRLQRLIRFVLIGGWAVYFYARALKSKDIDIIVGFDELPRLAEHYALSKNERLQKYEAVKGEVQIDIYLPHYSALGIPVEELLLHVQQHEGFTLLDPQYLTALKMHTCAERMRTPKGEKDFLDLIALLRGEYVHPEEVRHLLTTYHLEGALPSFLTLLGEHTQLPELDLNAHMFAKEKKHLLSAFM